jgi:hypothetical protein
LRRFLLLKADYSKFATVEETLDPEVWKELRDLGHRMVDGMFDYLENIRSRQTLLPTKEAVGEICVPLPGLRNFLLPRLT